MAGKTLSRSRTDKFVGGVCGGIANFFGVDSSLVRIVTVLEMLFAQLWWLYLVLWLVLPVEDGGPTGFTSLRNQFK